MKQLHRDDLFGWSVFDERRNLDFHGTFWWRPAAAGGNVMVDPVALSAHDRRHVDELGGVGWVVVTTSDHVRATQDVVAATGAQVAAPAGERETFPLPVDRWLADGDQLLPELVAHALDGSKTPGELALQLGGDTLVTGDLIRGPRGGALSLLPDDKLADRAAALASVRRLARIAEVQAVIVGDGWPVFRDGRARLTELVEGV